MESRWLGGAPCARILPPRGRTLPTHVSYATRPGAGRARRADPRAEQPQEGLGIVRRGGADLVRDQHPGPGAAGLHAARLRLRAVEPVRPDADLSDGDRAVPDAAAGRA